MKAIVSKFGGTSVSDAAQIRKMAAIVRGNEARRIVVVSAPGKRSKEDEKITDMLFACHTAAHAGGDYGSVFRAIVQRYTAMAEELGIAGQFVPELTRVEARIKSGAEVDEVVSRGEFLCAKMVAGFLNFEFVDAAEVICFAGDGTVDEDLTYDCIRKRLNEKGKYVIPGFYGARPDGSVRLFSRGGSDISGALVARGVGAELYENWTDVSGLLSADPRIVDDPASIGEVTYGELRELAYLGANVFHEEAVFPVSAAGIPINIRNTNAPENPGTMIVSTVGERGREATGIAGKRGYRSLFLEKPRLDKDQTFNAKLEELRNRQELTTKYAESGSDSMLMVVAEENLGAQESELVRALKEDLGCSRVTVGMRTAIVGVVGEGIARRAETPASMLAEMGRSGIEVQFVSLGYSQRSFLIGVEEASYGPAMKALYRAMHAKSS